MKIVIRGIPIYRLWRRNMGSYVVGQQGSLVLIILDLLVLEASFWLSYEAKSTIQLSIKKVIGIILLIVIIKCATTMLAKRFLIIDFTC